MKLAPCQIRAEKEERNWRHAKFGQKNKSEIGAVPNSGRKRRVKLAPCQIRAEKEERNWRHAKFGQKKKSEIGAMPNSIYD
ncbi:hypothetical protein [Macrococcoides caseolyticum]|uniref:hypothetical protein n=1 Tax=Macrococcoides caseolyticum TaxID=69966 RepID=UPI000C348ADA|nr:hypothetical protein [Macrococcus caseolyticus]PKE63615.1 hypothetical protein CW683_03445 [Macrococcus caseolyticus]